MLLPSDQQRDVLRRTVFDRYRPWMLARTWQNVGDLADAHPHDPEIQQLIRLTGRLYRLYYLIEDAQAFGASDIGRDAG